MKAKARQQEFGFVNRGGQRRGAGRKPKGERACVSHAKRPELRARHPVLVTIRLREGVPSLRCDAEHEVVRGALADSARETFHVVHYTVLSSHAHDAWRLTRPDPYSSASSFDGWLLGAHGSELDRSEHGYRHLSRSVAESDPPPPWAARARPRDPTPSRVGSRAPAVERDPRGG